MAMVSPIISATEPKQDKLRQLGILSLNGMFDEMDAEAVLRQAVQELLVGEIALVPRSGRIRRCFCIWSASSTRICRSIFSRRASILTRR